jgi:hypothetical protein
LDFSLPFREIVVYGAVLVGTQHGRNHIPLRDIFSHLISIVMSFHHDDHQVLVHA